MIELKQYDLRDKPSWDDLVHESRNGTFMHFRDYLEYHSDRFTDHSLVLSKKGKMKALLPGNINNGIFYSHQGLTYGGLVTSCDLDTNDVLTIFRLIIKYLKSIGIKEMIYKPSPYIYHRMPAQEDLYALFKYGAVKLGSNISSVVYQGNKMEFKESRKSGMRKAKANSITVQMSESYALFWAILNENLRLKYEAKPVHTLEEIELLKSKFPKNIKLHTAEMNGEVIAGVIMYLNPGCAHVQYISTNEKGRKSGALDLLFYELLNKTYLTYPVFDFGTSNEEMGEVLFENLIFQKEGFGGRGVVYDIYKLTF